MNHCRLAIEHGFIHVDVNYLGAVFYLLTANIQGFIKLAFENEAFEFSRAGDVSAFANIYKQRVFINVEGFQARKSLSDRNFRKLPRFNIRYGIRNGFDEIR